MKFAFYYGDYSVGITVKKDGTIFDVLAGTPGYDAGLGPNMTILAVDGRVYSAEVNRRHSAQAKVHPSESMRRPRKPILRERRTIG
jgi:predicted metalloprotease with PDZ domain